MAHVIVTICVVIIRKIVNAIAVLAQLTIHRNALVKDTDGRHRNFEVLYIKRNLYIKRAKEL